ncbi:hypothetical protein G6M02_14075 [Agrobacterium rhizogenes]|nr:hypothetical protein [Rhizobium rhizogenes]
MNKKPDGILDRAEQLRPAINRSVGFTPSERYLSHLADRTFLNLWSYPSPHREQKLGGTGDGKELCDLLVVCDPHIIIFSEKNIAWTDAAIEVAWPRWAKKSVFAAAKQLQGAERWIENLPDRIFLDKDCEHPFPLSFPPSDRRKIHRVIVARGAAKACRTFFNGGSGTLVINPDIKGKDHLSATQNRPLLPFTIGDIDPDGDFVHVFDEVALEFVLTELDTISDFTEYLDKRADFIRSGRLAIATGEEDLLGYYSIRLNEAGQHDFTAPEGKSWDDIAALVIDGGFERLVNNPRYLAKKQADKVSYLWDGLIEAFTGPLLEGTTLVPPGHTFSLQDSEQSVRFMALENRFSRRALGSALYGALRNGEQHDIFFRMMLGRPINGATETAFFVLTIKFKQNSYGRGGYEGYRLFRSFYLQTYAQVILMRQPDLRRVVGVAMEPPRQGQGMSEDNVLMLQQDWTAEQQTEVEEDCKKLGIWQAIKETPYHFDEFPLVEPTRDDRHKGPNRKNRRAVAALRRKEK